MTLFHSSYWVFWILHFGQACAVLAISASQTGQHLKSGFIRREDYVAAEAQGMWGWTGNGATLASLRDACPFSSFPRGSSRYAEATRG